METVQQHEWVRAKELEFTGFVAKIFKCSRCLNYKRIHPTEPTEFFRIDSDVGTWIEPPCITRTKQPESDAG